MLIIYIKSSTINSSTKINSRDPLFRVSQKFIQGLLKTNQKKQARSYDFIFMFLSLVIMFIKDIKYTAKSVSSIDLHLYIDNDD